MAAIGHGNAIQRYNQKVVKLLPVQLTEFVNALKRVGKLHQASNPVGCMPKNWMSIMSC